MWKLVEDGALMSTLERGGVGMVFMQIDGKAARQTILGCICLLLPEGGRRQTSGQEMPIQRHFTWKGL